MMQNEDVLNRRLIIEIGSGSELSFNILYRQWVSRLYSFVFRYVKSEIVADDIVQETFIRVWNNRTKLNPDKSFRSYLFTISYHLLLKELHRQLNNPLMLEYVEYENEIRTNSAESEKNIEFEQFVKALNDVKRKLSPRQREIFEMNKEQDISVAEISKRLAVTPQVVSNQLSAALKIIRSELSPYSYLLLLFLSEYAL
jgi:RNA polymerase sigma-70 factor (ECF subfamily)